MSNDQRPHPAFGGTVSALVFNFLAMPGTCPELASVKFAPGGYLETGSVLGVGADNLMRLSVAAATDGSQDPFAILLEGFDSTAHGTRSFPVAMRGSFNETALVYGAGHTADTVRMPLLKRGIFLSAPRFSYA